MPSGFSDLNSDFGHYPDLDKICLTTFQKHLPFGPAVVPHEYEEAPPEDGVAHGADRGHRIVPMGSARAPDAGPSQTGRGCAIWQFELFELHECHVIY